MKNRIIFKNLKVSIFIIGLLIVSSSSLFKMPVYALGPFLRINVTPSNISFNIVNAEDPEEYYSGNQEVVVVSKHIFPLFDLKLPWHMGIRSAEAYLRDSINPNNRIPISQLHWSKDGQNFYQLSQEWVLVNSYYDFYEKPYEENIIYRLYSEPNKNLPAGLYSVRIEFDARWLNLPWR